VAKVIAPMQKGKSVVSQGDVPMQDSNHSKMGEVTATVFSNQGANSAGSSGDLEGSLNILHQPSPREFEGPVSLGPKNQRGRDDVQVSQSSNLGELTAEDPSEQVAFMDGSLRGFMGSQEILHQLPPREFEGPVFARAQKHRGLANVGGTQDLWMVNTIKGFCCKGAGLIIHLARNVAVSTPQVRDLNGEGNLEES
jgi:hypothetical protein